MNNDEVIDQVTILVEQCKKDVIDYAETLRKEAIASEQNKTKVINDQSVKLAELSASLENSFNQHIDKITEKLEKYELVRSEVLFLPQPPKTTGRYQTDSCNNQPMGRKSKMGNQL